MFYCCYKYKDSGAKEYTGQWGGSCFRSLFSRSRTVIDHPIDEIIVYLLKYKKPQNIYEGNHCPFNKNIVEDIFDKVSAIFDKPEIEETTKEDDFIAKRFNDNRFDLFLSLKFNVKDKTTVYIKSILTFSRYFFEDYRFTDTLETCYSYYLKDQSIPLIELIQIYEASIGHWNGHTLTCMTSSVPILPVFFQTENELAENIKDKSQDLTVNGLFRMKVNNQEYLRSSFRPNFFETIKNVKEHVENIHTD